MLDTETKRRIDTARDILVGKVPDPKSQVEQITIALTYKFMDDMDAEAEEFGGTRRFFAGDFSRYGWSKLLHSGLGGHETLNLYAEAIQRLPQNPSIPPLFRTIFDNAYLPYRDPETLRAFLKIIDEFDYDHSERLGDAFEYLLSVLGAQGDAGQFRTPRHIIEFIVDVIDPRKSETILDPACGTAGFLISAYKHILQANVDENGHSTLTPDDRAHIAQNIVGYDISPDMVRLSLVNLYLHDFRDPLVSEYDTLTSTERWNEHFDVILANPPFMTPKGGIRPHNRFSIQSNRSEVLFVDYIAEHLTPHGRAAVIVPEGIVFQTQAAYKQLRKMLVEDYLVAVVSLPAGVFNPYSGVKTSILIFDRTLAKQSNTVGFFKVNYDGFSLGAQRRRLERNDLPRVQSEIEGFLSALRWNRGPEQLQLTCGSLVSKAQIAENGHYNLSGDRYRQGTKASGRWPFVPLGEATSILSGGTPPKGIQKYWEGQIPWVSPKDMKQSRLFDTHDHVTEEAIRDSAARLVPAGTVLCVVRSGILKHSLPLAMTMREMCFNQDIAALSPKTDELDPHFLFWALRGASESILASGVKPGVTVQSLDSGFIEGLEIPLPPLVVQRQIVSEIESYEKIIDGARAIVDCYVPRISIDASWPTSSIGEIARVERGASPRPIHEFITDDANGVNWIKIGDAPSDSRYITRVKVRITPEGAAKSRKVVPGDLVLSNSMSYGRPYIVATEGYIHDGWLLLHPDKSKIDPDFLYFMLRSETAAEQFERAATGGVVNNLNSQLVRDVVVPVPPLEVQRQIVDDLVEEETLVSSTRVLVARFERKLSTALKRIWETNQPLDRDA